MKSGSKDGHLQPKGLILNNFDNINISKDPNQKNNCPLSIILSLLYNQIY